MSVFFTFLNFVFSIREIIELNKLKRFIAEEEAKLIRESELDDIFKELADEKGSRPFTVDYLVEEKDVEYNENQPITLNVKLGKCSYSG